MCIHAHNKCTHEHSCTQHIVYTMLVTRILQINPIRTYTAHTPNQGMQDSRTPGHTGA